MKHYCSTLGLLSYNCLSFMCLLGFYAHEGGLVKLVNLWRLTCEVYACIFYCVMLRHNAKHSIILLKIMHRLQLCEFIYFCCVTFHFWLIALVFFCMMDFRLGCYKFCDVKWKITHNSSLLVVDYGIIVVEGGVGFETMSGLANLERETSEEILQAKTQVQQHQQLEVNQML